MKKTLILQCPGMVCSPPVVSKCLGEAHRRLDIIYIIYITIHFFFFPHTVELVIFARVYRPNFGRESFVMMHLQVGDSCINLRERRRGITMQGIMAGPCTSLSSFHMRRLGNWLDGAIDMVEHGFCCNTRA